MAKTKKIIYNSLVFFLLSSIFVWPSLVLAQWTTGQQNIASTGLPSGTITKIVTSIMNWLLALLGIVGVIGFVISGVMYLLAAGDDTRMKTAKQAMYYSIIGIIVGLAGLLAITAVNSMLGGTSTTF